MAPAEQIFLVGPVPGSQWIIVGQWHGPGCDFRAFDRSGREGGRATLPQITWLDAVQTTADAVWAKAGADETAPIVRLRFDPQLGRFSEAIDTMYTGQAATFAVTAAGDKLVVGEGVSEYSAWALDLRDALRGSFPVQSRLVRSTKPLNIGMSLGGAWILFVGRADGSNIVSQLSSIPFRGGPESPIALSGTLITLSAGTDPNMLAIAEKTSAGIRFTMTDLRSGKRGAPFTVPDTGISHFTELPDGGWAWIPSTGRSIRVQRPTEPAPRTFAIPEWFASAYMMVTAPDGRSVAFAGFNAAQDSIGLGVLSLSTGTFTLWQAVVGVGMDIRWLVDGSILLRLHEGQETITLLRLRGPGRKERIGTLPRGVVYLNVSNDLRRAAVVTRDTHGDAWISTVVKP